MNEAELSQSAESRIEGSRGGGDAVAAGDFWRCGDGIHALDDPTPFGQENALQKLGKPPFEKTARGRFRLLGYLATVYEHVARDVARTLNGPSRGSGEGAHAQTDEP